MLDVRTRREKLDQLRRKLSEIWTAPAFDDARAMLVTTELRVLVKEEMVSDVTKHIMGDPPSGRSALANHQPWTPTYDDGPIVADSERMSKDFDAIFDDGERDPGNRRFTDKPDLHPEAVRDLPADHSALVENRTLFPSTVVEVGDDYAGRLLVSGKNNRKLGEMVQKGEFKGYLLYGLSLEERATCPADCDARAFCYGNSMQFARRHKIADPDIFFRILEDEIRTILADPVPGLLVRLHVLGDFPSVEYVAFWADMLAEHDRLACYGYTHRHPTELGGDEIGDAIESLKHSYPSRFRVRWSMALPCPDGAVVIDYVPDRPRIAEGLVCPAQTDATACCASCGLCWESATAKDTIVFIKHGPKSEGAAAARAMVSAPAPPVVTDTPLPVATPVETRALVPIKLPPSIKPRLTDSAPPEIRFVSPSDLQVEPKYQRDLSGRSIKLIKKIVSGWDWAKFKPPVCSETTSGLFVIDGQHTAIAAASHPSVDRIPVMVVQSTSLEHRADAFVAHNRDRLAMSVFQVFHAEVAAGNVEACDILKIAFKAGATIPRSQPMKNYIKPGQIIALNEARSIYKGHGAETLERILRILVMSKISPMSMVVIRAVRIICKEQRFSELAARTDADIAAAIGSIRNLDLEARKFASETGQGRDRACAVLIENAARPVAA